MANENNNNSNIKSVKATTKTSQNNGGYYVKKSSLPDPYCNCSFLENWVNIDIITEKLQNHFSSIKYFGRDYNYFGLNYQGDSTFNTSKISSSTSSVQPYNFENFCKTIPEYTGYDGSHAYYRGFCPMVTINPDATSIWEKQDRASTAMDFKSEFFNVAGRFDIDQFKVLQRITDERHNLIYSRISNISDKTPGKNITMKFWIQEDAANKRYKLQKTESGNTQTLGYDIFSIVAFVFPAGGAGGCGAAQGSGAGGGSGGVGEVFLNLGKTNGTTCYFNIILGSQEHSYQDSSGSYDKHSPANGRPTIIEYYENSHCIHRIIFPGGTPGSNGYDNATVHPAASVSESGNSNNMLMVSFAYGGASNSSDANKKYGAFASHIEFVARPAPMWITYPFINFYSPIEKDGAPYFYQKTYYDVEHNGGGIIDGITAPADGNIGNWGLVGKHTNEFNSGVGFGGNGGGFGFWDDAGHIGGPGWLLLYY